MIGFKRTVLAVLAVTLTVLFCFVGTAAVETETKAEDLTKSAKISLSNDGSVKKIIDGSINTYTALNDGTVTVKSDTEIASVYIMWNKIPEAWFLNAAGTETKQGEDGFLHEFVEITPTKELEIKISGKSQITDIYFFAKGDVPDWVQRWDRPLEKADLLLFSTHSDDEQLFFAGLLPYYAIERQAAVQVVYMTHHNNSVSRPHELLNGLWTVGIKNYPVISPFIDDAASLGKKSESRETVLKRAQKVYNEQEWIDFQVKILRRFKPQAVVGHDFDGEYRHGAHILNSHTLAQALPLAADSEYLPETVEKYGVWDTKKAYFHLYNENEIVMDYDKKSERLGGQSPFEISKKGYACHLSQQYTWFTDWLDQPTAADIKTYSPCKFGLYRSTVGEDVLKNDILENIVLYADQVPPTPEPSPESIPAETTEAGDTLSDPAETRLPKKPNAVLIVILALVSVVALAIIMLVIYNVIEQRKAKRRRRKR